MDKKREIYLKIDKTKEIIQLLKEIKAKEIEICKMFDTYDKLSLQENRIFENWQNSLEETIQKLEHVTL